GSLSVRAGIEHLNRDDAERQQHQSLRHAHLVRPRSSGGKSPEPRGGFQTMRALEESRGSNLSDPSPFSTHVHNIQTRHGNERQHRSRGRDQGGPHGRLPHDDRGERRRVPGRARLHPLRRPPVERPGQQVLLLRGLRGRRRHRPSQGAAALRGVGGVQGERRHDLEREQEGRREVHDVKRDGGEIVVDVGSSSGDEAVEEMLTWGTKPAPTERAHTPDEKIGEALGDIKIMILLLLRMSIRGWVPGVPLS
ncbi:hypothetical protein THAOC_03836, partial [Thalassiosira oceanica]